MPIDSDNDGIPNHLELDSDGDGCYDSFEAGVIGATSNGTVTDSLAATTAAQVSANGFADALETSENGVYIGTYTYALATDSISACIMPAIIAVQDTLTIAEDMTATTIALLANDTIRDSEIDTTSLQIITPSSNGGIVTVNTNGTIDYTPAMNFNGLDTIMYEVCDTGSPALCDTCLLYTSPSPRDRG